MYCAVRKERLGRRGAVPQGARPDPYSYTGYFNAQSLMLGMYSLALAGNLILESSATCIHCIDARKYKALLPPDGFKLSISFAHREISGYWIVRVTFPSLVKIYNFSKS